MENENAVPNAEVKPAVAKTARKPRAQKTTSKVEARLKLPVPYNANKSSNLVLIGSMKDKFSVLALVKTDDKAMKNRVQVLGNADLGNLVHFVAALVTAWTGGTGIASDGATLYVAEYADTVLKTVPQIKSYDLVFSTSQAGAAMYRETVTKLIAQVLDRAGVVEKCIKQFGLTKPHSRKQTATSAPVVKL